MTPEELKEKIRFRRRRQTKDGYVQLTAILILREKVMIDEYDWLDNSDLERIKRQMRERMARAVYEDRRREFRELFTAFIIHSMPYDWIDQDKYHESVRKLVEWSSKL